MQPFKEFAVKRPFLFGLTGVVLYAVLGTLTYPVHYLFADTPVGSIYGDGLAKFLIFGVLLLLIWRLGWLEPSGLVRPVARQHWPLVFLLVTYAVLTRLFAFTGDISFSVTNTPLALANLLLALQTALVEETLFRGLVLVAMLSAWGDSQSGQWRAVLLSASFFSLVHLFNLMVRPWDVVLFQAVLLLLPGILYAALLLTTSSLWPAIVIHWLVNAAVNIKLIGELGYAETLTMWVWAGVLSLPLLGVSIWMIQRHPVGEQPAGVERPLLAADI